MNNEVNKEFARQIRAIGESLVKNADSIAGTEKFVKSISISVLIEADNGGVFLDPIISVSKEFYAERLHNDDDGK